MVISSHSYDEIMLSTAVFRLIAPTLPVVFMTANREIDRYGSCASLIFHKATHNLFSYPESSDFSSALSFSKSAICSAMDSFFLQPVFKHRRQRSSEHHWHILQSGQGCFFSMTQPPAFIVPQRGSTAERERAIRR